MRVLLLSEEEAKGILYCAGKGDHEILVAGNIERNHYLQYHPMCSRFIPLTNKLKYSEQSDDLIEEIISIIDQENIEVLLPSSFDCIQLVSRYRDRLSKHTKVIPTPSLETIDLLDNKYNFCQFCEKHGIRHPPSVLLEDPDNFDLSKHSLKYPIFLKPVYGSGEEGLRLFKTEPELRTFLENYPIDAKKHLPVLLQYYFEGEDIDFNGYAVNGEIQAWSVMHTEFYNKKVSFTLTDYISHDEVRDLGFAIVKNSGYSGPLNIDMRISNEDNRVYLIEVNPRFWARGTSSLMDGMNFVDVGIQTSTGKNYLVKSKISGNQWASSLSPVLKALILHRDTSCLRYLKNLSWEQIEYIIFSKFFHMKAIIKQKLAAR